MIIIKTRFCKYATPVLIFIVTFISLFVGTLLTIFYVSGIGKDEICRVNNVKLYKDDCHITISIDTSLKCNDNINTCGNLTTCRNDSFICCYEGIAVEYNVDILFHYNMNLICDRRISRDIEVESKDPPPDIGMSYNMGKQRDIAFLISGILLIAMGISLLLSLILYVSYRLLGSDRRPIQLDDKYLSFNNT